MRTNRCVSIARNINNGDKTTGLKKEKMVRVKKPVYLFKIIIKKNRKIVISVNNPKIFFSTKELSKTTIEAVRITKDSANIIPKNLS